MSFIEQLGQQAAGSILGIGLGAWNDARQVNQQKEMNEMNKGMMDYSMKKQYEMWQKTGYVGQMEQMKKAGINPALMYGMGGGGGQSTGTPGGGNATATGHTGEATGMGIAAANIGLMDAQRRNLDADTAEKMARVPGHGKEPALKEAQTGNLLQDTKNKELQNKIMEIDRQFQENTRPDRENLINQELMIRKEQLQIIENDATISEETKTAEINRIKAESIQAILKKAQIIADTKLSGAQKDVAVKQLAVMTQQIYNMINSRHYDWEVLREKSIERADGGGDDNNVYNIPIVGGLIKQVSDFAEQKPGGSKMPYTGKGILPSVKRF